MKLIIKSAIVLLVFATSIFIIESCTKVTAQTGGGNQTVATTTTPGIVQVGPALRVTSNGVLSAQIGKLVIVKYDQGSGSSIISMDYDGTNRIQTYPSLPSGFSISLGNAALSPDGLTVFFQAKNASSTQINLYSCLVGGTSVTLVYQGTPNVTTDILVNAY